ncbi:MAG: outer membrane protein assembly factor BamD [Bacteroidales bacterium]|nr:outer membrane protein assembly factor BamD [Bacteroidales bacterium]
MKHKILIPVILVALSVVSCKSEYELLLSGNDSDAKYAAAFDYFNMGKYQKAAQLFESLSMVTGNTERDDSVRYYMGLSNYRFKDYYTAETNFSNFINNYPSSVFSESARYLRIDCLYRNTLRYELDQTPTYTALTAIGEYLAEFPNTPYLEICQNMVEDLNERLDRKAYESAVLYFKMEDYKAARVALKNVLKDDSENIYREEILYYAAVASYRYAEMSVPAKQKERYLTFVDDYLNFVGEYPESSHRREVDGLYKKVQKKLGKYATVLATPEETTEE